MLSTKIREALALLDSDDDGHWTPTGLPKLEVVREIVDLEDPDLKIMRGDVESAAPGYRRDAREINLEQAPAPEGGAEVAPAPAAPAAAAELEPAADVERAPAPSPEAAPDRSVEDELAEIEAELAFIDRARAEIEERRTALVKARDDARARAQEDRLSPAEEYKLHVQRQHEERARRAANTAAIQQALGISVPGVDAGLRGGRNAGRHRQQAGAVGVRQRDMPSRTEG